VFFGELPARFQQVWLDPANGAGIAKHLRCHAGFKLFTEIFNRTLQGLNRTRRMRTEGFTRAKLTAELQ